MAPVLAFHIVDGEIMPIARSFDCLEASDEVNHPYDEPPHCESMLSTSPSESQDSEEGRRQVAHLLARFAKISSTKPKYDENLSIEDEIASLNSLEQSLSEELTDAEVEWLHHYRPYQCRKRLLGAATSSLHTFSDEMSLLTERSGITLTSPLSAFSAANTLAQNVQIEVSSYGCTGAAKLIKNTADAVVLAKHGVVELDRDREQLVKQVWREALGFAAISCHQLGAPISGDALALHYYSMYLAPMNKQGG